MDTRGFFGKKATTKPKRRVVKARVPRETMAMAVKKIVKAQIAREAENKQIGWAAELDTQHNSGITSADCYPLVQQISQGITAQSRVGDRVKPKSLKVRGIVSFNSDDCNTSQNVYVRVLILAQKNIKTGQAVASGGVDTGRLLKPSLVATPESSFAGNTFDLLTPVNTELFRVYMDKIIKLAPANVAGGGKEAMPMYSARWSKTFKQLPSSFTYDLGNGDWANNFAPFVALGYAYPDGTAPDTITTKLIHSVLSVLDYEDA